MKQTWLAVALWLVGGYALTDVQLTTPRPKIRGNLGRGTDAGVGNDLAKNLISFWKLSDLTDAVGTHTLTNNNVTTFIAGQIGNAAHFVAASSQSLTVASDASLQGTGSFSVAAWMRMTDVLGNYYGVTKWGVTLATEEYTLFNVVGFPSFSVMNTALTTKTTQRVTPVNAAEWHFYVGYYDSIADAITLSVDAGPLVTVGSVGGVNTGSAAFSVGSGNNAIHFMNGDVDAVGFWKRVLTQEEIHALYNSGNGVESPFTGLSALFVLPRRQHAA